MERIGDELETIPDRITREEWVAQAKDFYGQKYGKKVSAGATGD